MAYRQKALELYRTRRHNNGLVFFTGEKELNITDDQEINCYDGEQIYNKYRHSRYVFRECFTKSWMDNTRYSEIHYYEVLRARMLPGYGRYLFVKFKRREYDYEIDYKEIAHGFHNFMFVEYNLTNPIAYYTERERKDITYVFDKFNK